MDGDPGAEGKELKDFDKSEVNTEGREEEYEKDAAEHEAWLKANAPDLISIRDQLVQLSRNTEAMERQVDDLLVSRNIDRILGDATRERLSPESVGAESLTPAPGGGGPSDVTRSIQEASEVLRRAISETDPTETRRRTTEYQLTKATFGTALIGSIAAIFDMVTHFVDKDGNPSPAPVPSGPAIQHDTGLSPEERRHVEQLVLKWNQEITDDAFWNDLIAWLDRWSISITAQVVVMDTIKRMCKTGVILQWPEAEKNALIENLAARYPGFMPPPGQSQSHIIYEGIRDYRTQGAQLPLTRIVGADVAESALALIRVNLKLASN